ncbi:MAG: hypothetical protein CYG60_19025 [Actinobacteria bacterium]|nr:MAG: hypothetical protein CYG60_19025 [Actinomycetota bacterium]
MRGRRVPFGAPAGFERLTEEALRAAEREPPYVGRLLRLLADCRPLAELAHEQERGAHYDRLDLIADLAQIHDDERLCWYQAAEGIPLTDRHARHIIDKLKRRRA